MWRHSACSWTPLASSGMIAWKSWWILRKQKMAWQWHKLDHIQITCTSLKTDNHASTSPLSFYMPNVLPAAQPTVSMSKHWRNKSHGLMGWKVSVKGTALIVKYTNYTSADGSGRSYYILLLKFLSFFLFFLSPQDLRDGSTDREPF